ncbi:GNAT family N-acetyltransferase [Nonomuraea rhizosphaerae]|uniref:GNAT family N-acetyltransferase n=1 Tax=Nonomuraea rhizosphaerae TaxID=2665663 RepID=UPI001C5E83D3|nr:GNAT family N-acetyltransferase [Nonomuraea rhizosphaerae]
MLPREVISTGPLILRKPSQSDVEAITRTCDDPVTARFLFSLPSPYTRADAMEYLRAAETRWLDGGAEFTITENGRYVGAIGARPPDRWGVSEIGYLAAPWARGKGVVSTAARGLTDWLFDHGVQRAEISAEVENIASLRVAGKAGFREEGRRREARTLPDGRRADFVTFARLPRDSGEAAEPYLPFFDGGELGDGVVRLTPIGLDDLGDYHRMMLEPTVQAYGIGPASTYEEDERRCRLTGWWWLSGQRVELAIRDAATGAFAGHLQLTQVVPVLGQAMIGYSLLPEFRGRGLMSRAVRLLTDWAFAATPLHRIVAGTEVGNLPSQRVLQRAGFSRESIQREMLPKADGSRVDEVTWLRLRGS